MSHDRLILILVLEVLFHNIKTLLEPRSLTSFFFFFEKKILICNSLWNSWRLPGWTKSWQSKSPFLQYCRFVSLDTLDMARFPQFTFYPQVPRNSWCSCYQPQKDERLSRPWGHLVVLSTGYLDRESSVLNTRPLPHVNMLFWVDIVNM